ncbi:MAG: nuclear transport factor 2 family protein [Haloferacaceae archaeon]
MADREQPRGSDQPGDREHRREAVRTYYRALDDHEYDRFEAILSPSFTHDRPDRTLDGRDAFVSFMREDRPKKDTTHELDDLYANDAGDEIVARGRLLDADAAELFAFADLHVFEGDRIAHVRTYARR